MIKFKTDNQNPTHLSYSFYDKNQLNNMMCDNLCIESYKVYNLSIFCTEIFNLYKFHIYKSIYRNKKIKNGQYDDIIINKLMYYFDEYVKIKNKIKTNNNYIYKYIISYITQNNIIIKKSNFHQVKQTIEKKLSNDENIGYSENKEILFDNIIYKILLSIYNKNFNLMKNQMINHEPFTINDADLLNEIKSNDLLNIPVSKNYKQEFMQLKSDENYISRFIYKQLGDDTLNLQSTMICTIIKKAFDAHSSFYALKKLGLKANKPKFLKKNEPFNLIYFYSDIVVDNVNKKLKLFTSNRIAKKFDTVIDEKCVKLANNTYIHEKHLKKTMDEKKLKSNNFIVGNKYIEKSNRNIIDSRYIVIPIPKKVQEKKIKQIEIVPIYGTYKIIYTYENEKKEKPKTIDVKLEESISIDLGVTNFLTIYDPTGEQHIIKGGILKSLNYYTTKKIGVNQAKKNTIKINKLIKKREDIINNFYNKIVSWMRRRYHEKKLVIIGYNKNWKQNSNLGKKGNMIFNKIPFVKLINKIKMYFNVITTEESYTSKCDSLNLEKIGKREKYDGVRIKRGLFSSASKKLINADINGAVNIMRKQMLIEKIIEKNLFNPKVINVFRENILKDEIPKPKFNRMYLDHHDIDKLRFDQSK
jgi:hypothetical protein